MTKIHFVKNQKIKHSFLFAPIIKSKLLYSQASHIHLLLVHWEKEAVLCLSVSASRVMQSVSHLRKSTSQKPVQSFVYLSPKPCKLQRVCQEHRDKSQYQFVSNK
jgi:hypothetical protein